MDKQKRAFGLKAITVGNIAVDGGMGTTLTELFGDTIVGSAILESTEPTVEEIPIEESSNPIESITTADAFFTLKFNSYNLSPEVMASVFGGTVSGIGDAKIWEAPTASVTSVEKSVKVESAGGKIFSMPRVKLTAKLTANFQKTGIGFVEITGKVLLPKKAGTAPITMSVVPA